MKNILTCIGSAMAAIGISLMAIGCDKKESAESNEDPKGEEEEGAPLAKGDLEAGMLGFWALDTEAMLKEMQKQLPDNPATIADAISAIEDMSEQVVVEIPTRGEVVFHVMGQPNRSTYKITASDQSTGTLTTEVTSEVGTAPGTATIDGDKLTLTRKGDPTFALFRIDQAEFSTRIEAVKQSPPTLPEGLIPEDTPPTPSITEPPIPTPAP